MNRIYSKSFQGLNVKPTTLIEFLQTIRQTEVNSKQWNFFNEGYVHEVRIAKADVWYCRGRCFRSYDRKSDPHVLDLSFDINEGEDVHYLKTSRCSCTAG